MYQSLWSSGRYRSKSRVACKRKCPSIARAAGRPLKGKGVPEVKREELQHDLWLLFCRSCTFSWFLFLALSAICCCLHIVVEFGGMVYGRECVYVSVWLLFSTGMGNAHFLVLAHAPRSESRVKFSHLHSYTRRASDRKILDIKRSSNLIFHILSHTVWLA